MADREPELKQWKMAAVSSSGAMTMDGECLQHAQDGVGCPLFVEQPIAALSHRQHFWCFSSFLKNSTFLQQSRNR